MNLHITHDNYFFDIFIRNCNQFSSAENKFIVYLENGAVSKHVKSNQAILAEWGGQDFENAIGDLEKYKAVFIHYLTPKLIDLVLNTSNKVKFVLVFYGGEVFSLKTFEKKVYQKKTYDFFKLLNKDSKSFHFAFKPKNFYLETLDFYNRVSADKKRILALKRIEYFAHYIKDDYTLIKKQLNLKAKYIEFHYGEVYKLNEYIVGDQRTILLGNSADIANNHIDSIDIIARKEISNYKIFCPLSYAGEKSYIDYVVEYGKNKLGDKFVPLLDWMPENEYSKLIRNCSVLIMNQSRSQAAGNVFRGLCSGVKVYMNENSSLYKFLCEIGIVIHPLNGLINEKNEKIFAPMDVETIKRNVQLLKSHFSEKVVSGQYVELLSLA